MRERGFGLVEILIVLAVVAIAGTLFYRYFGATARTVEQFQLWVPKDVGPRPVFQCAGNDFDYDPSSGQIRLTVADPARC